MNKHPKFSSLSFKKMARTVFKSPLQFLAIILITALASTLFLGLSASATSLKNRRDKFYQEGNATSLYTTTAQIITNTEQIQKVVGDRGVVEGRHYNSAILKTFNATCVLYDELPTINKAINYNGTNQNFFIIDERYISRADLYGGGWIDKDGNLLDVNTSLPTSIIRTLLSEKGMNYLNNHVKVGGSNIFDSDYITFSSKPTGTMSTPENIIRTDLNATVFYMSRALVVNKIEQLVKDNFNIPLDEDIPSDPDELLAFLFLKGSGLIPYTLYGNNQYLTKLNDERKINDVENDINNYLKELDIPYFSLKLNEHPSDLVISNDIVQARQLTYIFPSIFFLVAILIVLTTTSQIIIKERNEIGTLKALGASSKSIILYYILLTLLVTSIGIIIGIIVGPLLIPYVMGVKYSILYNLPALTYVFPILTIVIMSLVILSLSSLVTFLIARKSAKELPSVSMRPKTPMKLKSKENKDVKLSKFLTFKMALRNIRSSIPRSLMVVLGVMGCTGLLTCGYGIDDSINRAVDKDIANFYNSDLMLNLSSPPETETFKTILKNNDDNINDIEMYSNFQTTSFNIDNNKTFTTNLYSLEPNYLSRGFFKTDNYEVKGDNVMITQKVAMQLNLKEGSSLRFNVLGEDYVVKVGHIMENFYCHGIFVDNSNPSFHFSTTTTNAYIRLYNHDEEHVNASINKLNNIKDLGIGATSRLQKMVDNLHKIISSISYMTLTIKIFAILLAVVALYNLALLNFKERTRDIATMKVLGFNKHEIARTLISEIMLLSLIGISVGLALGLPLEIVVMFVNRTSVVEYIYYVAPISYIISFVITFFTSLIVNIYLSYRSKKVKMVESLKSVE